MQGCQVLVQNEYLHRYLSYAQTEGYGAQRFSVLSPILWACKMVPLHANKVLRFRQCDRDPERRAEGPRLVPRSKA